MIDLSTIDARKQLVAKHANKWNVPVDLACAVCEHESTWNTWAVRFEPAFEARYIKPAIPSSPTTLELTKAMSFGLMQIMAQTAIELGFQGRYMTELCDPDVGVEYGCIKLHKCLSIHPPTKDNDGNPDYSTALLAYNGGSDPKYPGLVLQFLEKYADPTPPTAPSADDGVGGSS